MRSRRGVGVGIALFTVCALGCRSNTYRLRCKEGAATSPYSNEESATPPVAP